MKMSLIVLTAVTWYTLDVIKRNKNELKRTWRGVWSTVKVIIIGSDEKGRALKEHLKMYLEKKGYTVVDKTPEHNLDFVESASRVAQAMQSGEGDRGIAIDEYGAGSFMTATKFKRVIVAETSDEHSSKMTRSHNNASMITLGSGIIGERLAESCADAFIESDYAGGRHQVRVDMLNKMC